jgi:hypothetical protein
MAMVAFERDIGDQTPDGVEHIGGESGLDMILPAGDHRHDPDPGNEEIICKFCPCEGNMTTEIAHAPGFVAFLRRHPVVAFVILAYALSWWEWFWYRANPKMLVRRSCRSGR